MSNGDELLARVADGDWEAASDLLDAFYDGFPISKLKILLHSSTKRAVVAGAFIASELGELFAPLRSELPMMLDHPFREVRVDALDAVLNTTTPADGEIIARAVMLVTDKDQAVRWKAMRFLARATSEQLASAAANLPNGVSATSTEWLASLAGGVSDRSGIIASLHDPNAIVRRFAAAAASRMSSADVSMLEEASRSVDAEVRAFAADELELMSAS